MPITPLHYCLAYVINKAKKGFVLPALIVGSVIPDVEAFVGYVTNERIVASRGLMHSILGAATLDTFLAIQITGFLYPTFVNWIFRVKIKNVSEKCVFSGMLVFSALVGSLSHVLIDATCHEYNPLFYPFTNESFDAFVLLNDWLLASVIVQTVLFAMLLAIFAIEVRKGTQRFWERLLVE